MLCTCHAIWKPYSKNPWYVYVSIASVVPMRYPILITLIWDTLLYGVILIMVFLVCGGWDSWRVRVRIDSEGPSRSCVGRWGWSGPLAWLGRSSIRGASEGSGDVLGYSICGTCPAARMGDTLCMSVSEGVWSRCGAVQGWALDRF